MRGHEGNLGGVCSCGYLWLYWRGRAEEAEAKIEKLVAAGDALRRSHGEACNNRTNSCVLTTAWDRAKGEDEGRGK